MENTYTPIKDSTARHALALMLALSAIKLITHLLLSSRYGYFRDELYYLAAGRHLDWGYVDFAPLTALYARIGLLLGGSLTAIRVIPAVAGAALVALVMAMTRRLGGNLFAQGLAGLCILVSPAFLVLDNFLNMNAVEPLIWTGAVYVLMQIIQTGNSRLWIWFGVLIGVGLENKHSTLFFAAPVFLALLVSGYHREFRKPWIWLGGIIALLIFLPNLVWQWQHNFPTLEDLENVRRSGKNIVLGPGAFVWQQVYVLHPVLLPVWVAGLVSYIRNSRLRFLGVTYLLFFVLMFALKAKHYYLFPIYPMLIAGGAKVIADFLEKQVVRRLSWVKTAVVAIVLVTALPMDLFVLPVLPPEKYIAYSGFLSLEQIKTEVKHESAWPQMFADQFGWEELVKEIGAIYQSLPREEQIHTAILAGNYGEAGAIDFLGPKYGLPPAICGHQNYYFWGTRGFETGTMIVLQREKSTLEHCFESIEQAAVHHHPYGMDEENGPIYLCRNPKFRLSDLWPKLKHWN
jgi:hypothetical protein